MSGRHKTIYAVMIVGLIVLLPFGVTAVWDGSFPLTITIQAVPTFDTTHLLFKPCWNQSQADVELELDSEGEENDGGRPFHYSEPLDANTYLVRVPCSGHSGPFDIEYSYVEPRFLVVEFRTTDSEDAPPLRKLFSIPEGRGPRSMTITLP